MSNGTERVLVTGAGVTGGEVLRHLIATNMATRALVRRRERAEPYAKIGVELVEGKFSDPEAWRRALDGVTTVFSIVVAHPDAETWNDILLKSAQETGVKRIVRLTVVGIDPSPRLLAIARRRADAAGVRAELLQGSATAIPLADSTIDTVVMTWTLCSITDPLAALREMRRVLKPDGKLLFVEHGLSPEPGIERWQHRLTPIWCHVAGGCHLDRKMDDLIRSAGFDLTDLRTEYASGPRPMTYMYLGRASRH